MHGSSGTGHIVFQFDVSVLFNTDCTKGFLAPRRVFYCMFDPLLLPHFTLNKSFELRASASIGIG